MEDSKDGKRENTLLSGQIARAFREQGYGCFAVSDFYAFEFMRFLQGKNIKTPKDIQIIGFDDNMASRESTEMLACQNS